MVFVAQIAAPALAPFVTAGVFTGRPELAALSAYVTDYNRTQTGLDSSTLFSPYRLFTEWQSTSGKTGERELLGGINPNITPSFNIRLRNYGRGTSVTIAVPRYQGQQVAVNLVSALLAVKLGPQLAPHLRSEFHNSFLKLFDAAVGEVRDATLRPFDPHIDFDPRENSQTWTLKLSFENTSYTTTSQFPPSTHPCLLAYGASRLLVQARPIRIFPTPLLWPITLPDDAIRQWKRFSVEQHGDALVFRIAKVRSLPALHQAQAPHYTAPPPDLLLDGVRMAWIECFRETFSNTEVVTYVVIIPLSLEISQRTYSYGLAGHQIFRQSYEVSRG